MEKENPMSNEHTISKEEFDTARGCLKEDLLAIADLLEERFYEVDNPKVALRARACKIYLEGLADEIAVAAVCPDALTRYAMALRYANSHHE
jgi:hypothetical protein